MSFQVGDIIEFIRDTEWRGITAYAAKGDRGVIAHIRNHSFIDIMDIRMDIHRSPAAFGGRHWSHSEELPLSASNASQYIRKVDGEKAKECENFPPSLKKWYAAVKPYVRT
jgi:hypothetical protein